MKKQRTIIHITSEVAPFYKRGGLGDVVGALPMFLESNRYHNVVVSLFYDRKMNLMTDYIVDKVSFEYQGIPYDCSIYSLRKDKISYYFIKLSDSWILSDNENNDGNKAYSSASTVIPYFYFAKAVLQLIIHYKLSPDYIFCHDWQTGGFFGFTQLLKKIEDKKSFKSIFVIHNYEFQGDIYEDSFKFFEEDVVDELRAVFSKYERASLLSLGLKNSDYVATVSHNYAQELIHNRAPHIGLKYLDLCNREVLSFLNGIDRSLWNPRDNSFLPRSYGIKNLKIKREMKKIILKQYKFDDPENTTPPLVLMLCRLTFQKGIGFFTNPYLDQQAMVENMEHFLRQAPRFIMCGNPGGGLNGYINKTFSHLQKKFPGKFLFINKYREDLAHRLLAAADILIAPSLFEPCGLIQIYAMAFGTVPVVCTVGGLKDTVRCFFEDPENATGFYIKNHSRECLLETLARVVNVYYRSAFEWQKIMRRGMKENFSWEKMKNQYLRFFKAIESRPAIPFSELSRLTKEACKISDSRV
jgi:starch synthase